jgi:hypothetical protein
MTLPPDQPDIEQGALATGHEAVGPDEGTSERPDAHRDEHHRLHLAIALSIAVVSVLGALVSWRVEVLASAASEADQNAVAASITATDQATQAQTAAAAGEAKFARYQQIQSEANRLDPAGCTSATPPSLSVAEAEAACRVAFIFRTYDGGGYVGTNGSFDLAAYAKDVTAANRYFVDADPAPYQSEAAHARQHEDLLLYTSVGLVVALALFTLGRLSKQRRRIVTLAVPGWLLLGGGAGLFVAVL